MGKTSIQAYYVNKEKAKDLFKQALMLKVNNPDGLPKWRLGSRINAIINEMNKLGYHTTFENLKSKSEGGKVSELDDLMLLHEFTEVLGLKSDYGYAEPLKIYIRLVQLNLGVPCVACNGTGSYRLNSGTLTSCARCSGTGVYLRMNRKLLDKVRGLSK